MSTEKPERPWPPPSFEECVFACWNHPMFMSNWRRLRPWSKLGLDTARSPLDRMIDKTSGAPGFGLEDEAEVKFFLDFVRDWVWIYLVRQAIGTADEFVADGGETP